MPGLRPQIIRILQQNQLPHSAQLVARQWRNTFSSQLTQKSAEPSASRSYRLTDALVFEHCWNLSVQVCSFTAFWYLARRSQQACSVFLLLLVCCTQKCLNYRLTLELLDIKKKKKDHCISNKNCGTSSLHLNTVDHCICVSWVFLFHASECHFNASSTSQ